MKEIPYVRITKAGSSDGYLTECWQRRELLWFFARRDLVVRYRQTALGVFWVLLRPVLAMGIFSFLFGRIAKLDSGGVPYELIVLTGMISWQYFASVLSESVGSIANNPTLITKIYFPRMLMPLSSLILNAVDISILGALWLALMIWHGMAPGFKVILLPIGLLLLFIPVLGVALWTSSLAVRYKDVKSLVPIVLQFGILITPVAWSSSVLNGNMKWVSWLNPLSAPVEWVRWSLLPGMPPPEVFSVICSLLVSTLFTFAGYVQFKRSEARFADVI